MELESENERLCMEVQKWKAEYETVQSKSEELAKGTAAVVEQASTLGYLYKRRRSWLGNWKL